MATHQWSEMRDEHLNVLGVRGARMTNTPCCSNRRLQQKSTHMIAFCLAHVASRGGRINCHPFRAKGLDQRLHRSFAAKIDHRAAPIKHDQIEIVLEVHAATPPSKRLVTNSSPIAKPVDAPAPQGTMAKRTEAAGATIKTGRSAA